MTSVVQKLQVTQHPSVNLYV
ncbi:hypothetical protein PI27_gp119 [Listeria phage WIL-1]|nr:hypothetical protein PI27_gp119 [Listeria phage WIL-1]